MKQSSWHKKFSEWCSNHVPMQVPARLLLPESQTLATATYALGSGIRGKGMPLVLVAPDSTAAEELQQNLQNYEALFSNFPKIQRVPEIKGLRKDWIPENEAALCAALEVAINDTEAVFVCSASALLCPVSPPGQFTTSSFKLTVNDEHHPPEKLAKQLTDLDYDNEPEVRFPGEFSIRGGIVDIFSPLYDYPVRLEYFGDTIETMRWFGTDSQRSFEKVDSLRIVPRGEAVVSPSPSAENKARFLDYLPNNSALVLCEPAYICDHLQKFADSDVQAEWESLTDRQAPRTITLETTVENRPGKAEKIPSCDFACYSIREILTPHLPEQQHKENILRWQLIRDALNRWSEQGYSIVACCGNEGEVQRFGELLKQDDALCKLPIERVPLPLPGGIIIPEAKLVFLSEHEIFGKRHETRRRDRRKPWSEHVKDSSAWELEEGCYAVHAAHGICLYKGIKEIEAAGTLQEQLELEFADEKRLFVPFEQAHLVSRYVGGAKRLPRLNRMGSSIWKRKKDEAEASAYDLAAELLRIEAARRQTGGCAFREESEWERDFSAAFPYQETADQTEAINAVLEDMSKNEPMDRLLCGDVGYGKTEVAMRAAFRAVMNGRQVAVLVPTTVLAQQHFLTFSDRMSEYPIVIDTISRFRSSTEQKEIITNTALGQVDILIGTHRLLQNDVPFSDLGLVIIDEEQRFGVKHKEKFKQLRTSVDVLTMTATPIPRTLYFSLSGLRNLSTIMTPPAERHPVVTHVAQYNNDIIREALVAELERRGQVFFVHNRVQTISKMCSHLMSIVPEARFAIAHGQMESHELETVMVDFIEGEIDVLVCTTIIESGLDIPNANTIVIDRADRFGLAELYQLRGRVGRYHHQAYAYLLLPAAGVLPRNARERLAAIRQYTHLGAGFKLALRDLEIRGAGNILGPEQSGQIAAIGFDLYCDLLQKAVARLENKPQPRRNVIPLQIENVALGKSNKQGVWCAYIPDNYIPARYMRIDYHRRLSKLDSSTGVDEIENEMNDRFGAVPKPVSALLGVTRLRVAALRVGVKHISVREGTALLQTDGGYMKTDANTLPRVSNTTPQGTVRELTEFLQIPQ
ncbi:MAG: transcription-repair coupling factor [Lentisphaeria bacterium]